jgi:hypothetical protein
MLTICSFICSDESNTVKDKSYGPKPDFEELEKLLEAYFAQINGILQKVSTVSISFQLFYPFEVNVRCFFVFL